MKFKQTKKLIENVIDNEFNRISSEYECEDLKKIDEVVKANEKSDILIKKLFEVAPQHEGLISNYADAEAWYWSQIARYYFKMGVRAGTTNLNFLKDTEIMEYI